MMRAFFIDVLIGFAVLFLFCGGAQAADKTRDTAIDGLLAQMAEVSSDQQAAQIDAEIQALFFESGSATVDLLLQHGIEAARQGRLDLAGDFFDDVIGFAPNFAEGYRQRALLDMARGRYAAALPDLNRALTIEPRHYGVMRALGEALEALDNGDAAYQVYRDTLALNPFDKTARAGAARLEKQVQGRSL